MFFDNNIFSQNYSQEVSLSSQQQQENNEKILEGQDKGHQKTQNDRIEYIFEENRQLVGMVTGSLESLDKYSEKLQEDLEKLDVELKENEEIFKAQKQILIDLQMQNENLNLKYQQEIQDRKEIEDKTKFGEDFTHQLLSYHNEITGTVQNFQDEFKSKKEVMSEELHELKQIKKKSERITKEFEAQKDSLLKKLSALEDESSMYVQEMTNKRVKIREQTLELSEKKEILEKQLNKNVEERNKLSERLEGITVEHEHEKKEISTLKLKLKKLERKKTEEIPELKSLIEKVKNELTNVNKTREANGKLIAELKLQCNQSSAKIKQLESSIVEARDHVAVTQEEKTNITKMNNELEIKKKDLQNEVEIKTRKQAVILRLRKKLEDRKAFESNLKSNLGSNKNNNIEANKKLMKLKEEVESIVAFKNNLAIENTKLQEEIKKQELVLQKNKEDKESKIHAICESLNFQKEKIHTHKIENENLALQLKSLKETVLQKGDQKRNLEDTYKRNLEKLEALKLEWEERKKTILANSFIYNEAISDEESMLSDLEDELIECKEELKDLSLLRDLKDKKETALKEMEKLGIAEINEETERYEVQKKDLEKERALYQANIDAISQQEEKKLVEMEHMISSKKQSLEVYEKKLQNCKLHLEMSKNKEEECKSKVVKLEEKLNQVSNTAKVTRNDIKSAFASTIEKIESKPVSSFLKNQPPEKKRRIKKQVTPFTKDLQFNLMTPISSVEPDIESEQNVKPDTKASKKPSKMVKKKDAFDFW